MTAARKHHVHLRRCTASGEWEQNPDMTFQSYLIESWRDPYVMTYEIISIKLGRKCHPLYIYSKYKTRVNWLLLTWRILPLTPGLAFFQISSIWWNSHGFSKNHPTNCVLQTAGGFCCANHLKSVDYLESRNGKIDLQFHPTESEEGPTKSPQCHGKASQDIAGLIRGLFK